MILYTFYAQPVKTIIAIIFTVIAVWTIAGISVKRDRPIWWVINCIIGVLSIASIFYTTIIHRTIDGNHTMPFIRTIEHIRQQPELIREMVMNAFLFFPFGLCLPYALSSCLKNDEKGRKAVLITILSALLLSSSIELTQYLFNFGNCELSDIVMNTLGAAIGSVSYLVSCRLIR